MPSTVIRNFHYNEVELELTIEFISGSRYKYLQVRKEVVEAFKAYREKGVFYNQHIKGKFAFEKISNNRL